MKFVSNKKKNQKIGRIKMTNKFEYKDGWLVELPEMEKPFDWESYSYPHLKPLHQLTESTIDYNRCVEYENYLTTLRRFKYDYPCEEGAELVEGKDFEVKRKVLRLQELSTPFGIIYDDIFDGDKTIAIPITPRTFSEQDLLDTWDAAAKKTGYEANQYFRHLFEDDTELPQPPDKEQFFKTRFNIEIH